MMEALDEIGGPHEDLPPVIDPPKSAALDQELRDAKTELLRARPGISPQDLTALTKKLEEANKALKDFSHGNLIKQIEEQHKTLKAGLIAAANMTAANELQQRNKQEFENAVQVYLNKRLELAKVRLQEIAQEDKQTSDARNQVCGLFRTPTGVTGTGEVIANLGSDFNHIERTKGIIFKSSVTVKFENGVLTSNSPRDLALAAKAKGWNTFVFNKCKVSYRGVDNLISSVEEMLKIGIKGVSIDPKLMEKIMANPPQPMGHSSGDYAEQLAKFLRPSKRNVSSSQKQRIQQLQRICAASSSAYKEKKGNPVFDADGNMISGKDAVPKPILHQVDTFMRLTSDTDRREYLEILAPMHVGRLAADFVDELNKRGVTFVGSRGVTTVFQRDLSPEEYFRQKMLPPNAIKTDFMARRSEFDEERDRVKKIETFNKDATTLDDRKAMFLAANDESLLRRYARSEKLNGPGNTNDTRVNLVKAVFRDVQTPAPGAAPNPHAINLHNPRLSSKFIVREEDKEAFLLKTLALFENIKVLNAARDATDFVATAQLKTRIIRELREEAWTKFTDQKVANNPEAFNNFLKNKILIDELEQRMLVKHFDQQKIDHRIPPDQHEAKFNRVINRHLETFNALPADQKVIAFISSLSPELQQRVWNKMRPDDPQTIEFRARVLKQYIQFYERNPSPSALHFLNSSIEPLMRVMTRQLTRAELIAKANQKVAAGSLPDKAGAEWTDAELLPVHQEWVNQQRNGLTALEATTQELHDLCLRANIHGTKPHQNKALSCIRENIAEMGSAYRGATASIESNRLFKDYFDTPPGRTAEKLVELLKCYAAARAEISGPKRWLLDRRFKDDMRELLYPGKAANADSDDLIQELYEKKKELCPNPANKEARHFIKALNELPAQINAPKSTPAPSPSTKPNAPLLRPEDTEVFDVFDNL